MNADDLIRQVKDRPRFRLEVGLLLDTEAFAEARALNERLANFDDDGDVTAEGPDSIVERLHELHRSVPETRFVLEARNAPEWEALNREWTDPTEFSVALFAECCVEPAGWDYGKAEELRQSITAGQWATLVMALQKVNEGLFDLRPTFAAYARTSAMRPKSSIAPLEESDIPSF